MKSKYAILIFFFAFIGCKDEVVLESGSYEQIMVVDGFITNESGPYKINLSLTAPINSDNNIPLEGYVVTLFESTGEFEVLTESEPGVYVTSHDGIQGVIGNEYGISIISPEGTEYRSDFQKLMIPVGIESLYAEIDTAISTNYPFQIPGYQFYIDSKKAANQESYFLWSIEETYEYDSDYAFYYYINDIGEKITRHSYIEKRRTCWKTKAVDRLFTGTTSSLSESEIRHQPLHFVGTDTKKLYKRYSIILSQYTISEEAYSYWRKIENLLEEDNFLYVTQPYNITGNVKNVNNPQEQVFGYFSVVSVSKKRSFFDKPLLTFYYDICYAITDPVQVAVRMSYTEPPYYFVLTDLDGVGLIDDESCLDCTSEGGTVRMPSFWIYY